MVSFIKFVCQSSRQFCESAGDKGGSTPPALLLLLSRLCLDYETSTISYILTLTDEQFLVQVNGISPYKCSSMHKRPYCTVKIQYFTSDRCLKVEFQCISPEKYTISIMFLNVFC